MKGKSKQKSADSLLTHELPEKLRNQIVSILQEIVRAFPASYMHGAKGMLGPIYPHILKELGVQRLSNNSRDIETDIFCAILELDPEEVLTVVQVLFAGFYDRAHNEIGGYNFSVPGKMQEAIDELNRRFQQHAVGYEFRDGRFTRIDSSFLHTEVVEPAIAVLHQPHFAGAEQEFSRATDHFRHGRYVECLNECLKAFESTMKAICHQKEWEYDQTLSGGKLVDVLGEHGLYPAFMKDSMGGLVGALKGVVTMRNKMSAHGQGVQSISVPKEVAAFALHSTAANIVFLASLAEQGS
jgi:hypothetical protein